MIKDLKTKDILKAKRTIEGQQIAKLSLKEWKGRYEEAKKYMANATTSPG